MRYKNRKISAYNLNQAGQSLVEVTVAAAALAMGLVAVMAGLIVSLHNTSVSYTQTLATQQNQEAVERFRQFQRELGWESFYEILDNRGQNVTYCLQTLPETTTQFANLNTGACSVPASYSGLIRQAQVIVRGTEVEMIATTTWQDGTKTREAIVTHIFKNY